MKQIIELEINPDYIQFPILAVNEKELYVVHVPRNIMVLSDIFDDETIHCVGYDLKENVMMIINHKKSDDLKEPPVKISCEANYYYKVDKCIFDDFIDSTNKTKFFEDNIENKYNTCTEPMLPYFL